MLTIGVDDSGRGPLIGPLILAGVLLNEEQEKILKKHKVRDSKTVLPSQRLQMAELIEKNIINKKIAIAYPKEIDESVDGEDNLKTLEAKKTAEVINALNKDNETISVIIDCPSTNKRMWLNKMLKYLNNSKNLVIRCEHKADRDYVAVSAASVLAKCAREEEVAKIKKEYGNIGSGYPADPITVKFLKENGEKLRNSSIFRKSWATWKKMFPGEKQRTLAL